MEKCKPKNDTRLKYVECLKKMQISQLETLVLYNAIKQGVYKELYRRQMLTEFQLNELLAWMEC